MSLYNTCKQKTYKFIWWSTLLLFEFQLLPSQHLTSIVQVAGLKRVPKYKWPRTETVVVTQEAT